MPKHKKVEATDVASPRSPKATDEKDNNKQTGEAQAQELPEWAKNLPDEILIRTWEID